MISLSKLGYRSPLRKYMQFFSPLLGCSVSRSVSATFLAAIVLASCSSAVIDTASVDDQISDVLSEGPSNEGRDAARSAHGFNQGFSHALNAAVRSNDGYRAALSIEREALAQAGVSASFLKPQLSAGANAGSVRETGADRSTTSGVAGGVSLSQLVYDGGASASAVNRATALAVAAQAGRVSQSNDLALGAARAWIDLWQYSERLRLMHHRTSEMATLVDMIERMASNGLLDRASLDSARRQIVEIRLEETRLRAGQAETQVLFRRFFDASPTSLPRPPELVSADQARTLAANWQNAPVLERQAAEMLAAQAAVDEAAAAFRPRATLQAGARTPMERGEPTDLTVGLSLEYTFSDGGRRRMQLESAEARHEAMVAQLSDAQRGLEAELEAALTRLDSMQRSIPLLEEKRRLSQSEAETSRSQLSTGQSNLRQLIEAEIEIYRAQDQQIVLEAERQILLLTIAARTGALSGLVGLEE